MAQKVIVSLVDDLDGTSSEDTSTITFGLDGANYEIDPTGRMLGAFVTHWRISLEQLAVPVAEPSVQSTSVQAQRLARPLTVSKLGYPGLGQAHRPRDVRSRTHPGRHRCCLR